MSDKAMLVQALYNAQEEVKLYKGLYDRAEQSLKRIEAELNASYQHMDAQYTAGQIHEVREGVLGVLDQSKKAGSLWVPLRAIIDELADMPTELVTREVHKLNRDRRCNVIWNGRKGPASRYART